MKSVQISVLASAVGIALVGAGLSPDLLAKTLSASADVEVAQAGAAATAVGRYIITFSEPGLVAYKGGVSGLQRTAPQTDNVSANSSRKFDAHSSAASAYRNYLVSQRATHIAAIEQKLGHALVVRYTYDVTRNAISVQLNASEAALVMHVEGVATVSAVTRLQPDTFRGPTFIGANTIWDGTGVPSYDSATRGQGVKVGVVDTGTNAAHPSFANDPACGFSAAHPKLHGRDCTSNDGTVCTGTSPDAPDGQGHGVHTSSTAAGNTIDNTFTPPPLLPDGVSMSGVAPCADVYAYRVAEDDGSLTNDAITAAIQNAIVDQVDVINFSIGPTCGGGNPWDDSLDFLSAEGADIFVAASAGNTRSTCTNPTGLVANNGPWMMTVAASSQDEIAAPVLSATGPGTPPPLTQNIALIAGSTTLPASSTVDLTGAQLRTFPSNPIGCTATGVFPAGYFSNAIAILRRGTCAFTEKITNAYNAGARTVVIVNNQPGSISMATTGAPTDVAAFSTYKAAGDALIAFVDANLGPIPAADAVFADGFELPAGALGNYRTIGIGQVPGDILAAFSFRGPTQAPYDNLTKPDITGPGVNIYAAMDTASGSYGLESGTSMSSPHLAGSAALVRAVQPTWSPMEIKSAIQTTAKIDGVIQDEVTPWNADDVGSGRVDLSKATRAGLTLDETPDNFLAANPTGGSINMKDLNIASMRNTACGASCTWTRKFKNRLNASGTWTPTAVDPAGYHLTFSPASITVAPGFSKSITITATATGAPTTALSYGRIDLHESANLSPDQHLTVAIKGGTVAPPSGYCNGGNCNLQVDSMTTSFGALGCATYCGFMWMNRFTPDANEFPITLNSVTTIFGATAGYNATGDHINVYVYQDADGDPTNGATLVGSYIGYTMPAPANAFATITLPTPIVIAGPGDVIIALTNPTGNVGGRPAALDTGAGYVTNRSYISNGPYVDTVAGSPPDLGSANVDPVPMDAIGISKMAVIRGTGTNGGGRPITLSNTK